METIKFFIPVGIGLFISFVFGWRLPFGVELKFSADIFPYGIPFGLILIGLSIWKDDERFALASAPFISPYISMFSWLPALFPIASKQIPTWLIAIIIVLSWIAVFIWHGKVFGY